MIDELLQEDLESGAQEYFDALTDLVEVYERQHVVIPDASARDVLQELMRANGLNQSQLANKVGIAQSTISDILTGERKLTPTHMVKLGRYFNVAPAAFMPAVTVDRNLLKRLAQATNALRAPKGLAE
jgi:HTH-type transcriptional regulator/antitoxin HigA